MGGSVHQPGLEGERRGGGKLEKVDYTQILKYCCDRLDAPDLAISLPTRHREHVRFRTGNPCRSATCRSPANL